MDNFQHAKEWFKNEILKNISITKNEKYLESIFLCINDKIVMDQDLNAELLLVDYEKIWDILKITYSLNDEEIKNLIKDETNKHFNEGNYKTSNKIYIKTSKIGKYFKNGVFKPKRMKLPRLIIDNNHKIKFSQ